MGEWHIDLGGEEAEAKRQAKLHDLLQHELEECADAEQPTDEDELHFSTIMQELGPTDIPNTLRDTYSISEYFAVDYMDLAREFTGMMVLNVGSGMSNLREIREMPGTTVVDIDNDPYAWTLRRKMLFGDDKKAPGALADIRQLPVPDESVDSIIASFSLPVWAEDRGEIDAFFDEMQRVIKPGGKLYIAPLSVYSFALIRGFKKLNEADKEFCYAYFNKLTNYVRKKVTELEKTGYVVDLRAGFSQEDEAAKSGSITAAILTKPEEE